MEMLNLQATEDKMPVSEQPQMDALIESLTKVFSATLKPGNDFDEYGAAYTELAEHLVKHRVYELAVEDMKHDRDVAALIQERYTASIPPLDELMKLPEESLGYVYASSLKQAGLNPLDTDPTLFSMDKVDSDVSYVEHRYQITHDIWHVVTGFDTSEIGELGLVAFYLAQFRLPTAGVALANGLMTIMLFMPEELPNLLRVIEQGWQMGKTAKQLLAQKWEEGWDKSVAQWQAELNVEPIS